MLDHAWLHGLVDPDDQVRARALERQRAHGNDDRGFAGPIAAFLDVWSPGVEFASFALLFLRWEALRPGEWRDRNAHAYSPWSIKEQVLRRFAVGGVPDELRSEAADLVLTAIRRRYRCKDWRYAGLVHHVPTDAFRPIVDDPDPLVSARARFLLHVADHPGRPLTRTTWPRWLAVRTDVR